MFFYYNFITIIRESHYGRMKLYTVMNNISIKIIKISLEENNSMTVDIKFIVYIKFKQNMISMPQRLKTGYTENRCILCIRN